MRCLRRLSVGLLSLTMVVAVCLWLAPATFARAPDVTFSYLDGQKVPLQALRGKPVLVIFWATTCTGCLQEMPRLMSLYNELSEQGLEIIGVAMSYDPPNRVVELVHKRQVPYPVSLDIDGSIAKSFGDVSLTPSAFLISAAGDIIKQHSGGIDARALRAQIMALLATTAPKATALN